MVIRGTNNSDTIDGGAGDDMILGKGGDDIIRGGRGNDKLFGGDGSDHLIGGQGDDFLIGGGRSKGTGDFDKLQGGPGSDTYVLGSSQDVFYLGEGFATLIGFNISDDTIRLNGSEEDYQFILGSDDNSTSIFYNNDLIAEVEKVTDIAGLMSTAQYTGSRNTQIA